MSYSPPASLPTQRRHKNPIPKVQKKKNDYYWEKQSNKKGVVQEVIRWVEQTVGSNFDKEIDFIVAGSSILSVYESFLKRRSFNAGDIDLYFLSNKGRNDALKQLTSSNKCVVWYESQKALRVEATDNSTFYDFVKRQFYDASEVLDSFDFHIVSLSVQRINGVYKFCCTEQFLKDIKRGIVRINNIGEHETYGLYNTLKRIHKYVARGYKIDDEAIVEVMKAINGLNMNGISSSTISASNVSTMFQSSSSTNTMNIRPKGQPLNKNGNPTKSR